MRIRVSGACGLVAASVAALGLVGSPATAKEATTNTILDSIALDGTQNVVGYVDPVPDGGDVVVKYFKRKQGDWVLLHKEQAVFSDFGMWNAAFDQKATKGTCKLVANYKGTADFGASQAARKIDCGTGLAT